MSGVRSVYVLCLEGGHNQAQKKSKIKFSTSRHETLNTFY